MIEYRVVGWKLEYRKRGAFGYPWSEWRHFKKGETKRELRLWLSMAVLAALVFIVFFNWLVATLSIPVGILTVLSFIVLLLVLRRFELALRPFLLSPKTMRELSC